MLATRDAPRVPVSAARRTGFCEGQPGARIASGPAAVGTCASALLAPLAFGGTGGPNVGTLLALHGAARWRVPRRVGWRRRGWRAWRRRACHRYRGQLNWITIKMMRIPRSLALPVLASVTLFTSELACGVNPSGLNTMPVLPHDGSVMNQIVGTAGDSGTAGTGATAGVSGATGTGAVGSGTAGTGAAGSSAAGTGAAGDGNAGSGAAGTGAAGAAAGTGGAVGGNGDAAAAGTGGMAGSSAGTGGGAGTGAAGCGPGNCAKGCCEGNTCVLNRSAQRCGSGGGACQTCSKCEVCSGGSNCDVDPSSNWTVVCAQATVAMSPDGGGNWDPHSGKVGGIQPDPFCEFEMPAHMVTPNTAGVTDTIVDSFTPVWNQTVTPAGKTVKASDLVSGAKSWRLWVGDDDGCNGNTCQGQLICEITQPLPVAALRAGTMTQQNVGSCLSLTVNFVCAQ
jgi:hypothetical protein